jgi:hypothetical protein
LNIPNGRPHDIQIRKYMSIVDKRFNATGKYISRVNLPDMGSRTSVGRIKVSLGKFSQ